MSKKIKVGLLPQIIIAIAAGVGCGLIFPMWATRFFATFNALFSSYLGFVIPLLIIGYVAPAIAEIGGRAGKMLLVTVLLAYVFTFLAGMFSYATSVTVFPKLITPEQYISETDISAVVQPFFTVALNPLTDVTTALVFAFVLGLCSARMNPDSVMRRGLDEFRSIISMLIYKSIIPLLPIYIFGIFLTMTVTGTVATIMLTFVKIIVVIFIMHVALLLMQYCIAGLIAGRNPFKTLWTMMPAYFTALGTQSSAATIPVTLEQTIKMGVNKQVAGFVIPLCATIHLSGSTLKIVACALALMMTLGHHYDFQMFSAFIAMIGITMIAAPGVPGGAIMAALGLLSTYLGFTDAENALMIALYIAMDSFGTACNVTGDGSIALIINRFFGKKSATLPQ